MADYQEILNTIYDELLKREDKGEVADYIPELAKVDSTKFGIYLNRIHEDNYGVGDAYTKFSIQSISKVFTLAMAFANQGNKLWNRVDVEPSGNPFNYLALLEQEEGIPRNPLINSGAIVVADCLLSTYDDPKAELLKFVRQLASDDTIDYNPKVAQSEMETGYTNFAIANLLKSYGNLENSVEDVLDFYFHQCSLEMTCEQLSNAFFPFANKGVCMKNNTCLTPTQAKRINAIMLTCGFYDEAGEFAFEVGLPGKSGVGGGIVALLPDNFIITTWSPGLNEKGNSYLGMLALEKFTTMTKASIF
ncbi:MAG TPA: glutaminase [Flavobacteriaceae bacterium]|nr:glutaminase [Flavobacteriaceae bacterium]HBR54901.1 glutaminase [Flavobacteriaceae bacterium]HIB47968.1 glutaminase [Flavobacteriaceae bacterium]HIN98732.1 glutaminase [Flavobacteriaceae bacterium]